MVWVPKLFTRQAISLPLEEGRTGTVSLAYTPGAVTLIGRNISMPAPGVIALLPAKARPITPVIQGLIGRDSDHKLVSITVTDNLELLHGAAATSAKLFFCVTYPRKEA